METFAYPSLRSLFIEAHREGVTPAFATGFVVETVKGPHLITNRHVVTGANNITNVVSWIPTKLTIQHHKKGHPGEWVSRVELLVVDNVNKWCEHPSLGCKADFVAVPLTNLEDVELYFIDPLHPWYSESDSERNMDFLLNPSDIVSIVGFPFGKSSSGYIPIWVTGFLASELGESFEGLPIHLIDSRTRPGQSGSPVFAYRSGGAVPTANGTATIFSGPVAKFIGVYSGRINENSDLGRVWKTAALAELVQAINSQVWATSGR
jgi:hypothetical protein